MMGAVVVGLPDAAQDRLPADVPGARPGRPGVPRRPGEGCRAARAPARERGAAPARRPGTVRAGRPGVVRRAGTAPAAQALDRDLPRDARDAPGLAPQARWRQVRHEQAAQARPPADGPGHRSPGRSPGKGESAVGTPPDPWRAGEARHRRSAVHRVGDPARCGHRSGASPVRPDMAAVPACPGCRDPRGRFPARGHRAAEAHVRAGVHRARYPPDASGRRHRAPHRRLDSAAGPQPRPHPRRAVRGASGSWSAIADRTSLPRSTPFSRPPAPGSCARPSRLRG